MKIKYIKNNTYKLIPSQEYNPKLLNVNIEEIEKIKYFNEGNNFIGLTFSTTEKKVLFNRVDLCKAFINDKINDYDVYSILKFKAENLKSIVPFYKFIINLKVNDILRYIEDNYGKESGLYELIKNDTKEYKKKLGVIMDVEDFPNIVDSAILEKYVDKYMKKDNVIFNQRGTVTRNVLLKLLNNNIDELVEDSEFCEKYYKDLCICITNLSEKFILSNFKPIQTIIRNISQNKWDDSCIRNLLRFLDKVVYRKKLKE